MVEVRVAVADAPGAHALAQRLAELFEPAAVSLDATRHGVSVCLEQGSLAVIHVISAVESWLALDSAAWATLSLGDRSYSMFGPAYATPSTQMLSQTVEGACGR